MHRSRHATGFLLAPILLTLVLGVLACSGGGPEKGLIDNFFRASRLGDAATLGGISMASYNPREQGQVTSTSVISISDERVTPLHLKELAKEQEEARKASDDLNKRKLAYQDEHTDQLNRLLDAEKKGLKIPPKDAAFQAAWNKWREETAAVEKRVSEAREKLQDERSVADASLASSQNPIDPTAFDGDLVTKDYTVSANVVTPNGQNVTRTLLITLQQARLKSQPPVTGRWIITKIQEAPGGKAS